MCKLQIYSPYRKKQGSGSSPLCTFLGTCRSVSDPEPVNTLLFFNVDPLIGSLLFLLSTRTPYVPGDMVKGRVYEISGNFGVFVAVDDKYSALIPAREATGKYRPGAILDLRVTEVKEDGKMNVSDRQKAYIQINEDAESVLSVIEEFAGVLPFDDHASPEVIKREFGLSKNAFKRAVGHLMKEGKVEIRDKRIYIKK